MPYQPPASPEASRRQRWWRSLRKRVPWLLLSVGMLAFVAILVLLQPLPRVDRMLQDNARAEISQAPTNEIVIVAIDEKSIEAIGRWPWRRALHAELLRRIAADAPRCIGLDLLMTEPDTEHPGDDRVLANGISDSGCVVLPMALQVRGGKTQSELLPLPALADAATSIGHSHVSIDEDGVARTIYLQEGFAGRTWPHFTKAIEDAAEAYARGTPLPPAPNPHTVAREPTGSWLRRDHQVVVFTRGDPPFKTVSYVDVIRGLVPKGTFTNHYVLVGTTAAGLGDLYATSATSTTGLTPGVTIFGSVLQGLITDRQVILATPLQDLAFNLGPLVVALLGLLWLRPVGVVILICAMLALRLGLHASRPLIGVQFAPAAGFFGLLLVYPLWSLMRLTAAIRYLRWGTEQLNEAMAGLPPMPLRPLSGDFLDREMAVTSQAGLRMRDLQRFIRDGIDHLPDATMILSRVGVVFLGNIAASRHWQAGANGLVGRDAHELLADLRWRTTEAPMMPPGLLVGPDPKPLLGEGQDSQGRSLLLRCVPFYNAGNSHAGWMVALVDITRMRQIQSQRDEALRFISHDIREPSAAILTILELLRASPGALSDEQIQQRIRRHAETGLELADGFVNLARAEAQPFRPEMLDVVSLLEQTIDDAWAQARKRNVQIVLVNSVDEALCLVDRSLLTRALKNVLSNALKYSPAGADLRCHVIERPGHWALAIQDQGPGIPVAMQSQLFQPFHRLHSESHPEVHGVGLGLLLVRTVVQRHGGSVEIDSVENAGCTVTLVLPKPTAAELAALGDDKEDL
ncbi:CHASE2 domain-containing protein [Variovorax sp. dw_954]|uniref:CHASE2 domain-containing protein n=1 Tax=Variovorax sp. dw_954 TaxID=2720078 RepID=UPI001BD631C6|nr:CHASE2 domain-containing protein [Variovorax sp. dw_954]